MTQFINLDELDSRIKSLNKPTPQQVVNLIMSMYAELRSSGYYTHRHTLGLTSEGERPYA